uniref:Uncharacterized protein n=1 Tax=Arcella intermedia TaxID=1963864 RepID=A0A6B2LE35_9EUKA
MINIKSSKIKTITPYCSVECPVQVQIETFNYKKKYVDTKLSISILSPLKDYVPFELGCENGKTVVSFVPSVGGIFNLHAHYNNLSIANSPHSIIVDSYRVCKGTDIILDCCVKRKPFLIEDIKQIEFKAELDDEGAKLLAGAIERNTTLQHLSLIGNFIGDEGGKALANSLLINSTLESMDLDRNHIGDIGVKYIGIALHTNTSLNYLDICNNSFTDEGAKFISSSLLINTQINYLNLSNNRLSPQLKTTIQHNWKNRSTTLFL